MVIANESKLCIPKTVHISKCKCQRGNFSTVGRFLRSFVEFGSTPDGTGDRPLLWSDVLIESDVGERNVGSYFLLNGKNRTFYSLVFIYFIKRHSSGSIFP